MICQFVGGPIDGERREMGDAPPTAWNVADPPEPVVFAAATDQLSESMVPGYMTYYRHAFVERHSRAALYAYFCGVEVTSVVPIVLGGQLYLTRPRDIQNVGANVLAKMFRPWCWTSGTWSSTSHQRGVHDVGATYADGIRVQFRQNAGEVETPKGRFPERYAQHAFDSCVGKEVPLKLEDRQVGMATLIAAKVIEDGRAVLLTYEIPPPAADRHLADYLETVGPDGPDVTRPKSREG